MVLGYIPIRWLSRLKDEICPSRHYCRAELLQHCYERRQNVFVQLATVSDAYPLTQLEAQTVRSASKQEYRFAL